MKNSRHIVTKRKLELIKVNKNLTQIHGDQVRTLTLPYILSYTQRTTKRK